MSLPTESKRNLLVNGGYPRLFRILKTESSQRQRADVGKQAISTASANYHILSQKQCRLTMKQGQTFGGKQSKWRWRKWWLLLNLTMVWPVNKWNRTNWYMLHFKISHDFWRENGPLSKSTICGQRAHNWSTGKYNLFECCQPCQCSTRFLDCLTQWCWHHSMQCW